MAAGACWMRCAAVVVVGMAVMGGECSRAQQVADAQPSSSSVRAKGGENFVARWVDFYRADWKGTAVAGPAAARRGLPSPLSSPPFPNADWSYGGSPPIGEADGNVYPLQTAIDGARRRTKIYGWIEPTVNGSTPRPRNYPTTNDIYSNRVELGQAVVYVERMPDSVQREHIDWGFHLTAFYG